MSEIKERLKDACNGHPNAIIPWPHRLLHDAIDAIWEGEKRIAEAESASASHLLEIEKLADENRGLREQVRYWYQADKLPLPDEGSYLVIVERPKGFDFYAVAQQTEDGGMEDMDGQDLGYEASDISHWMPLPPPPQDTSHD
jgi:hypothetical protein